MLADHEVTGELDAAELCAIERRVQAALAQTGQALLHMLREHDRARGQERDASAWHPRIEQRAGFRLQGSIARRVGLRLARAIAAIAVIVIAGLGGRVSIGLRLRRWCETATQKPLEPVRKRHESETTLHDVAGLWSETVIDLDAYCARIGYHGSREPSLDTLHALSHAHVCSIPFENIDVVIGRPIDVSLPAIEKKLVKDGRGGYCFEQNTFFLAVLEQLGYRVRPLSARVRYQRPREFTPARTHLCLRVELDESWLADVGVGGLSLTSALRLASHAEQSTSHEPRRLLRENGRVYHQVRFGNEWHDVCELTLEEMPEIDRIVANWYTSTHPASHFKHRLLVARAAEHGARVTLADRELTLRSRGGTATQRTLESHDELVAVLAEHFSIRVPDGVTIDWGNAWAAP